MLRLSFFLIVFSFYCNTCAAQFSLKPSVNYFKDHIYFNPTNFLIDPRFEQARTLQEMINVSVEELKDIELLMAAHVSDHIYGLKLSTKDSLNFEKSIQLLAGFPNLEYLRIDDMTFLTNHRKSEFQLPESIKLLSQLKLMEFYGARTLDMPDAIKKISNLKNLRGLSFVLCPDALPQQLAELSNISNIKLSTANMEGLDLRNTKWQSVLLSGTSPNIKRDAEMISKLTALNTLRDLSLNYCALADAEVISKFKQLRSLSVYGPAFHSPLKIMTKIGSLSSLEYLSLNNITDTTESLDGLEQLKVLKYLRIFGMAALKSRPDQLKSISKLKKLEFLELQDHAKTPVPDLFKELKSLRSLTIGGHELSQAISNIFLLPSLDTLVLSANELRELPALKSYACRKLRRLDLRFNNITVLPQAVLDLHQLELLDLSHNKLGEIPTAGWAEMSSLKDVNFESNEIMDFPGGLELVGSLTQLNLSNNKISSFPEFGAKAYRLKSLLISGNELRQLPSSMGSLHELEVLDASFNKLNALPASLGDCRLLKQLKLKHNEITSLPDGLRNTQNLEQIDISENAAIDGNSVFQVLLSLPRKHLSADLSSTNLNFIPASDAWQGVGFARLNLNDNKISSLPVQFAQMKTYGELTLNNNPLGIERFLCNRPIKNKSDMKILYDELGLHLQDLQVSNAEYAAALAERVSDYYWSKKYQQAIAYADKASSIDSAAYIDKVSSEEIGMCRFNTGDFKGAVRDFNQFIIKESKKSMHWGPSLDMVERYKSDAHLALGEKDKAADTHIYFARHHSNINGFAQAAVIYKEIGNDKRAAELMDTVLLSYQARNQANIKYKNRFNPSFLVEYAEILIIAGLPDTAISLLNSYENKQFPNEYLPIKNYLMGTAMFLNGKKSYEQVTATLLAEKGISGKVSGWSFDMFNSWMKTAISSEQKRSQLLALQTVSTQ